MVPGFFDTPLLLWALKRTPGNLDRVYFERSILGLNRHFLQVPHCFVHPKLQISSRMSLMHALTSKLHQGHSASAHSLRRQYVFMSNVHRAPGYAIAHSWQVHNTGCVAHRQTNCILCNSRCLF